MIAADEAATPTTQPGERLTVGQIGDRYVASLKRKGRKPETWRDAEIAVRVHFVPFFGDRPADSITQEDVERLSMHLSSAGARVKKGAPPKGLAPKSVRNYLGTLAGLFNFAVRKKLVAHNPVSLVELPQVEDSGDIRFLTPGEVRTLVAQIPPGDCSRRRACRGTRFMILGTRSGRRWPLRGCRCGRCRSGWDIGTSPRRSGTRTTRRRTRRPRSSHGPSRPTTVPRSNRRSKLSKPDVI